MGEKRIIRVAAAQIAPVLDRPGGTLDKVLNAVAEAADKGVRFLVFPETFVPYYPYFSFIDPPYKIGAAHLRLYDEAVVVPGPVTEAMAAAAVAADPWFAGYCGVMVNLSDVAAMGGRPIAIVDALWSASEAGAAPLLDGMREAARRYGVPIVGGHSNLRADRGQLAVAILGRALRPITSFAAQPGDALIVATDLRGRFRDPFPWWDASTSADPARLRADLRLLPEIAEDGLVTAGKDISMAGVVGTTMMLAEASGVGATIQLDRLPMPQGVTLERWLTAFPSFGFVLSARPERVDEVIRRFQQRDIACAAVGRIEGGRVVTIEDQGERAELWDFARPFTGCTRRDLKELVDA